MKCYPADEFANPQPLFLPIDPLEDGVSRVEYIQHVGSDKMIVNAARVSYARENDADVEFSEKDRKLLKFLIENSHGTPLEHNLITFKLTAPLYVVQEFLRHRHNSFNQESQRYAEPGRKNTLLRKFYVPNQFRQQDTKNKQSSTGGFEEGKNHYLRDAYILQCEASFETYNHLIGMGVARELARGVLPHSTYTSLYFTCNVRSLLHFLGLRLDERAQEEIRMYAQAMQSIAKYLFPETFSIMDELGTLPKSKTETNN